MNVDELLCRAKRVDNGKWVEGYYSRQPVVDLLDLAKTGNPMPESIADYISVLGVKLYHDHTSGKTLSYVVQEIHRVIPDTLCRYTGMNDIHGKRIFENDFIICTCKTGGLFQYKLTRSGIVQIRHGAFGIMQNYVRVESWQVPYTFRPFKGWLEEYEHEIIGNKFDNPTTWARFIRAGGSELRYE